MRYLLIFISFSLFLTQSLISQQTIYFTNDLKEFREGKDLFDREMYRPAQVKFEEAGKKLNKATGSMQQAVEREIQFYKAVCSAKLKMPAAELALQEYIQNNPTSIYTQQAHYYLGSIYFEQHQYEKALKEFEATDSKLLNKTDKNNLLFERGYSLFHLGKKAESIEYFRPLTASAKNKYHDDAVYFISITEYEQKKYSDAEKGFLKIESSEKYKSTIPFFLSQVYYQQKNYDKVIAYLEPKINQVQSAESFQLSHLLGQSYFEKKQYDKSIPYLKTYVDESKKVTPSEMYQLAFAYYKTGRYKDAIERLKELQFAEGELGQNSMYALADCYLKTNLKKEARAAFAHAAKFNFDKTIQEESSYNYSKLSYELGEDNESITGLKNFLSDYPASKKVNEAKDLLAKELIHTKNYPEAIELMEEFDEFTKENQLAFQKINYFYAVELYNDDRRDESLKHLDKSINNASDEIIEGKATFLKGEILYEKKQYKAAIDEYASAFQIMMKKGIQDENYSNIKTLYGRAYAHYMLKEYNNAAMMFGKVLQEIGNNPTAENKQLYEDAVLRNADCYFILRNFDAANNLYSLAIEKRFSATDYALLNKATLEGLLKNNQAKIDALSQLILHHENSIYLDDALFQLGSAYEELGDLKNARAKFNRLLEQHKRSDYAAKTLLKLGLISYNENNKEEALSYYKQVAEKYPNTSEADQAFKVIKETYLSEGKVEEYIAYIESSPNGRKLSTSEQDSLLFDAGEESYASGDCAKTIHAFNVYLNKFPAGYFAVKAHFYRGECLYKDKKFDEALNDYAEVISNNNNPFMEKVLLKSCFVLYNQKRDYEKSYTYYAKIKTLASNAQNAQIATLGLMRTTYYTSKYEENITYCDEVLNNKSFTEDIQLEATYYKAKSAYATGKSEMAKPLFEIMSKKSSSEKGAESKYMVALITNAEGKFEKSLDLCFELKEDFASYEKWVVKGFILIADNYLKMGDDFQAKATIESILNNYDGDKQLAEEAKAKLAEIEKIGQEKSKIDYKK